MRLVAIVVGSFGLLASVALGACSTATTNDTTTDAGDDASVAIDAADAAPLPNPDCDTFCAKVSAAACSAAGSCKADCQKQLTDTPSQCRAEVRAVIACSANEGKVTGCDAKGKAKLEGCNTQLSAYLGCLLGGGGSDGGTDAGSRCNEITSGNAACDTCMDASCCKEETACAASPDCLAFDDCIAKGTARATCEGDHPRGRDLSAAIGACRTRACRASCP